MIIDTSALVAILRNEAEAVSFAKAIAAASNRRISAATFVEVSAVMGRGIDPVISRQVDYFLEQMQVVIEPVTEQQARIARDAYRDFGKGSRHPAQLNFGDCFAYALAKDMNEPLLFKGDGFRHTDVKVAL